MCGPVFIEQSNAQRARPFLGAGFLFVIRITSRIYPIFQRLTCARGIASPDTPGEANPCSGNRSRPFRTSRKPRPLGQLIPSARGFKFGQISRETYRMQRLRDCRKTADSGPRIMKPFRQPRWRSHALGIAFGAHQGITV